MNGLHSHIFTENLTSFCGFKGGCIFVRAVDTSRATLIQDSEAYQCNAMKIGVKANDLRMLSISNVGIYLAQI